MLLIGWTTVSSQSDALKLADALVSAGRVACAQIDGPITSVYRWEGQLEREQEFRVSLKFTPEAASAVERDLMDLHPYDTPQWIVVKAEQVAEKYLSWAKANSSSLPFNASQAPL